LGTITSIAIAGRSPSGVVSKVLIKGTAGEYMLSSDAIRSKLGGLRSNMFIIEPKLDSDGQPESFIFYGGGWGHGVGLCQSGAAGMAAGGYKSAEILSHYYPGTELTVLY
jgi:SpoIID/LytB domain protein